MNEIQLNPAWTLRCRFGAFNRQRELIYASDSLAYIRARVEKESLILIIRL